MVSMKDIAAECGVSVATVSKALNDKPDISEETRKIVCRTADKMGYFSNSAAVALKTHRTYNLGVLFVDERQNGLRDEYFSQVLDGFRVEAESRGYDITFINRNVGKKHTSYLNHCRYRSIDGLVIACINFSDPQVQELINSEIPVVTIDHAFEQRISVISDNSAGMEALTKYMISKGHRRIAYITGENIQVTENRVNGFKKACREAGIEIPPEYIRYSVYCDSERCAEETKALLNLQEPPTCILFPDDYSSIGGIVALREAGLRVPEDISVAGYDGSSLANVTMPKLTTYRQDTETLGRDAARRLIRLIERPKSAQISMFVVPGYIVEGDSVAEVNR